MTTLRTCTWIALLMAVVLGIYAAGAGQWLLVGVNTCLAAVNVLLLYETRNRNTN